MIKLVNGIPEKLTEVDEQVTFIKQVNEDASPVILINKFNVDPEEVDEFLKAFAATGEFMKKQPGFISAQYTEGLQVAAHSSTMKFGSLPITSSVLSLVLDSSRVLLAFHPGP